MKKLKQPLFWAPLCPKKHAQGLEWRAYLNPKKIAQIRGIGSKKRERFLNAFWRAEDRKEFIVFTSKTVKLFDINIMQQIR